MIPNTAAPANRRRVHADCQGRRQAHSTIAPNTARNQASSEGATEWNSSTAMPAPAYCDSAPVISSS